MLLQTLTVFFTSYCQCIFGTNYEIIRIWLVYTSSTRYVGENSYLVAVFLITSYARFLVTCTLNTNYGVIRISCLYH